MLGSRGGVQLLVLIVIVVVITSLAVISFDVTPVLSEVMNKMQNMEKNQAAIGFVNLSSGGNTYPEGSVVVSLDQIMKAPVSLNQDDPRLIKRIREKYLHPPSEEEYNLKPNDDPSMGQSTEIRKIFGEEKLKKGGFYVECGALDGETRSNTLVFEKKYGWEGVLVEGDPKNFELVKAKNRKAWTVDACLSTEPYPNTVMFKQHFNIGKISKMETGKKIAGHAEVQCLPFYSLLLSLNRTTVDYFSLDVEGAELEVLRTIPWDKVDIKTLSVEFIHGKEGKSALKQYMIDQGYNQYTQVTHKGWLANDYIFVKNDFVPHQSASMPKKD